jgi:hypothetical protein
MTDNQVQGIDPIVNGSGCITWHSTWESSGDATALYSLTDGNEDQGQLLMRVSLIANESTRDYLKLHHLSFLNGLFFSLDEGIVQGTFHVYTDHVCEDVMNWHHAIAAVEGAAALKILGQ